MGKFNPAGASRADFTALFNAWKDNDLVTELYMRNALQSYHTAYINPINVKQREKYDPCYDEVVGARGGYETLDERLDAMSGGGGASDYDELDNRPQINSVTLTGNKSLADLGIAAVADLAGKANASDLAAETAARAAADTMQEAVLAELLKGESQNMLDLSSVNSATVNGITWTVDADRGVITANGTASANSFFYIWPANTNRQIGYKTMLVGAPEGGSTTTYELQSAISSTVYHDYGSGAEVPAGTIRYVTCCVRSGASVSDLEFKPMLCAAVAYSISPEPVPYHPPISDMWNAIRALQSSASVQSLQSPSQLMSIRPDADLTGGSEVPEDA